MQSQPQTGRTRFVRPVLFLGIASSAAMAQQMPIRPLGATTAASKEVLGQVNGVRALSDGRVLVNDPLRRRLVLFDATLATATVVADSTPGSANSYARGGAAIISYAGDSTLFVDVTSSSFLVIDGTGKIARVMSAPRTQDVFYLIQPGLGAPGIDNRNRLVYRGIARPAQPPFIPGQAFVPPTPPDTAPIMRVDLATRKLDTAAWIKIPKLNMSVSFTPANVLVVSSIVNPLSMVDDWALLSDGSIAILRARDYHIDWVYPDGEKPSSAKITYDWQRLADEDKIAIVDSTKRAIDSVAKFRRDSIAAANAGARVAPPPPGAPGTTQNITDVVSPSELPDYMPPFRPGTSRADRDGNLWVLITRAKTSEGGPVYDVINRRGELIDRVQLPVGRLIAGFGREGAVFLTARDGAGDRLERARVR